MTPPIAQPLSGVIVDVKRLVPYAVLPEYKSAGAVGMDLHAALETPIEIEPGAIELVPTGIAIALPEGYEAQIRPRSGLAAKHGIGIPNAPGSIDHDYRGQVLVAMVNLGREPFTVRNEMRIAQMVIAPVVRCTLRDVETLDETARGAGGFGSTGV